MRWLQKVVVLLLVMVPASVSAQEDPNRPIAEMSRDERDQLGREAFERASKAYDEGRYNHALTDFQRALELSDRAMLHYNIALCQDRLGQHKEALQSYEAFLRAVDESPHHENARARAEELRAQLAEEEKQREREREAEAAAAKSITATPSESPSVEETSDFPWLWVGLGAGLLAVGAGVAVAVAVASGRDDPPHSDFGATTQTLWRVP